MYIRPIKSKRSFFFETGDGYRAALNGIYRKMTSWSIYGSNLKWGIIDAWGAGI